MDDMPGHPSTIKGERREQEILQAAADLFFEKGFHATSLEDIAKVVGIRKSGLYHYSRTKDDLLFDVLQQGMQIMLDELQTICGSKDRPTEKLRRAVENHVLKIATHRSMMGVILREDRAVSPQKRESYLAMRDAYEGLFRGLVREGVEAGVFRRCNLAITTRAILGMCGWLAVWYRPGGALSPESIAREFMELILKGLERAAAGSPKGRSLAAARSQSPGKRRR
jgi:AcrR family transcriptional regulator